MILELLMAWLLYAATIGLGYCVFHEYKVSYTQCDKAWDVMHARSETSLKIRWFRRGARRILAVGCLTLTPWTNEVAAGTLPSSIGRAPKAPFPQGRIMNTACSRTASANYSSDDQRNPC